MKYDTTYIDNILSNYFSFKNWTTWEGPSGVNNSTRFVSATNSQFVLRIYETHQDEGKVRYEHHILLRLKDEHLTFSVPEPVQTLKGDTLVRTADGKIAVLFHYLSGENPSLVEEVQLQSFGRITGLLTEALAKITSSERPAYRPYYEIESTHPTCSPTEIEQFCHNPPTDFSDQSEALQIISDLLSGFVKTISTLKNLPHQLVHGDLNASNILVTQNGLVTSVLDFEFVTKDLRVMELAVCLSDLIDPDQEETIIWNKVDAFLSGYSSVMKLTEEEIDVIPVLISLRSLDVFIHFLGRYRDGIDPIDLVKKYCVKAARNGEWLKVHKEKLDEILRNHLFKRIG